MKVKHLREMLSCISEENDEQEVYADGRWIKSITIGSWTRTCQDQQQAEPCKTCGGNGWIGGWQEDTRCPDCTEQGKFEQQAEAVFTGNNDEQIQEAKNWNVQVKIEAEQQAEEDK